MPSLRIIINDSTALKTFIVSCMVNIWALKKWCLIIMAYCKAKLDWAFLRRIWKRMKGGNGKGKAYGFFERNKTKELNYFRDRERKPRKKKDGKKGRKKVPDEDDGLTAKQRRKIVSKAIISSSEGSDSEGEKLKIDVGR